MTVFTGFACIKFIEALLCSLSLSNDFQKRPLNLLFVLAYFAQPEKLINHIRIFVTSLISALDFQA